MWIKYMLAVFWICIVKYDFNKEISMPLYVKPKNVTTHFSSIFGAAAIAVVDLIIITD